MIRLGRRTFLRCVLALGALIPIQPPVAFAAEQVDLLLVLASDVSRSVDHPKFLLQREGYAAAISDPQKTAIKGLIDRLQARQDINK